MRIWWNRVCDWRIRVYSMYAICSLYNYILVDVVYNCVGVWVGIKMFWL